MSEHTESGGNISPLEGDPFGITPPREERTASLLEGHDNSAGADYVTDVLNNEEDPLAGPRLPSSAPDLFSQEPVLINDFASEPVAVAVDDHNGTENAEWGRALSHEVFPPSVDAQIISLHSRFDVASPRGGRSSTLTRPHTSLGTIDRDTAELLRDIVPLRDEKADSDKDRKLNKGRKSRSQRKTSAPPRQRRKEQSFSGIPEFGWGDDSPAPGAGKIDHGEEMVEEDTLSLLDPYYDLTTTRLKKIFATFDQDEDGVVSYEAFRRGLGAIGITCSDDEAFSELLRVIDVDSSGDITFNEFQVAVMRIKMADLFKKETIEDLTENGKLKQAVIGLADYSSTRAKFYHPVKDPRWFFHTAKPAWAKVRWVNVQGTDELTVKRLAIRYRLHPLSVEDVLKEDRQRPKFEIYEDHRFLVVPMIRIFKRCEPLKGKVCANTGEHIGEQPKRKRRRGFWGFWKSSDETRMPRKKEEKDVEQGTFVDEGEHGKSSFYRTDSQNSTASTAPSVASRAGRYYGNGRRASGRFLRRGSIDAATAEALIRQQGSRKRKSVTDFGRSSSLNQLNRQSPRGDVFASYGDLGGTGTNSKTREASAAVDGFKEEGLATHLDRVTEELQNLVPLLPEEVADDEWQDVIAVPLQVSIFIMKDTIVTIQEDPDSLLWSKMQKRLSTSYSKARQQDAQFLLYSLLDSIVDMMIPIVDGWEIAVQLLEDKLHTGNRVDSFDLSDVHSLSCKVATLHRIVKPMREVVRTFVDEHVFSRQVTMYLRDVNDHLLQLLEDAEYAIQACRDLTEEYHNMRANRQNEVMYLLSVVTTLFIPAQFLTGVYGMNFENMPELKWKYSYYVFWIVVAVFASSLLYYFKKVRKWL